MSGILSGELASLSYNQTFTIQCGSGTNTGPKTFTFSMFGWCPFTSTPGPGGVVLPDAPIGKLLTGNPGTGTSPIAGIWESQSDSSLQVDLNIAFWGVYTTSTINTISINGTVISGSGGGFTGLPNNTFGITRWVLTESTTVHLNLAGPVTIIIT